ncbi:hypothetical protein HMPREF9946_03114 [Acetobacteraceae bacterium AT-5844]|nr:hypothetical protein HMPREF9946_03114 [Acetobacteraceae bacterium AT-5844]
MVAQGILEREDAVNTLMEAAIMDGYRQRRMDLSIRLHNLISQEVLWWEMRRNQAPWKIRKAIQPSIQAWCEAQTILSEASDVNDQMGQPLLWHELRSLVAEELTWALKRQRRTARRRV